MPPDLPPLAHAAHVAALISMTRRPDPSTSMQEAKGPCKWTLRAGDAEKLAFDNQQLAVGLTIGRRVTQGEALRWMLAFVVENEEAFLTAVRRYVEESNAAR